MEKRLLVLIGVMLAAALAILRIEIHKAGGTPRISTPSLPSRAGEWRGTPASLSKEAYELLGADHVEAMYYDGSRGDRIGLFIVEEDKNRASFHPPEYCFLAQSNARITDKKRVYISLGGREREVSSMIVERAGLQTLVLYWYQVGDFITPSYYAHQLAFAKRFFRRGGEHSLMVRLTMDIGGIGQNAARREMQDLIRSLARLSPLF